MSKKKIVDADALLAYITDWKGNLEKHSTYDGHERVESAIETLNCLMGHIEDEAAYMDEILPQWTNADKEPPKKGLYNVTIVTNDRYHAGEKYATVREWMGNRWLITQDETVTHWAPMLKPAEEEQLDDIPF